VRVQRPPRARAGLPVCLSAKTKAAYKIMGAKDRTRHSPSTMVLETGSGVQYRKFCRGAHQAGFENSEWVGRDSHRMGMTHHTEVCIITEDIQPEAEKTRGFKTEGKRVRSIRNFPSFLKSSKRRNIGRSQKGNDRASVLPAAPGV